MTNLQQANQADPEFKKKKTTKLLRFACLCALIVWQLLLINNQLESFWAGNGFAWRGADGLIYCADFLRYYVAGEMARSADHLRVYDVPAHLPYLNALIAPLVVTKESSLSFPPSCFAIMSLVSSIPLLPAYVLWVLGSVGFGCCGLALLLKRVKNYSNYDIALFLLAANCTLSSAFCARTGQWTWWLIGLICFFFCTSLNKREIISGVTLGLLILKPQFSLPLFVLTLRQKRWRTLAVAMCTIALLYLWAVQLIGLPNVLNYPKMIATLEQETGMGVFAKSHASLRGLFANLLSEQTAFTVTYWLYWSVLVGFGLFCLKVKKNSPETLMWLWSMAILVGVIFAPSMFAYDVTLVCIPAALTLVTISPLRAVTLKPRALMLWHLILISYPIVSWLRGFLPTDWTFLYALLDLVLLTCAVRNIQSVSRSEFAADLAATETKIS